ncbi:MAG: CDP-diacylglycerol--serine O-phosphatidyltransferase [Myxococcota bacterium]|nr:CDP-diacylglycerol--serine O-phosphatidyltransferase [Myxococcota bacterium]
MLHYILRPANLFTASSLFCGFYSIVLSASAGTGDTGAFHAAAVLILFAGLFDLLDGPVARLTRTTSDFGMQLDSFADLVSFGIAPGVLLFKWGLAEMELVGFAVAFLFVLSSCFRLARFNLGVDLDEPGFSKGLTITVAGGTVASLVIFHHKSGLALLESQLNVILFTVFLSYLMLSEIRFRTMKSIRFRPLTLAVGGLAAFSFIVVTVLADMSACLVAIACLYIGLGLLEGVLSRRRRRHLDALFDLDDDPLDELEPMDDDDPLEVPAATPSGERRRWWPFRRR